MGDKTPAERPGENPDRPLWHGRFSEGPADALMALSVSIDFDQREGIIAEASISCC